MTARETIRRKQLIQHAEGYLELGMPRHALDSLERLGEDGHTWHAYYLRGEALRSLDRWTAALDWFHQASDLMPDNIHIWLAMGWCYKRIGQLDLAIEALENALAVDSSEAIIHYNLACYWCLAANKGRTLDYLSQAFEIDADYRDMVGEEHDFDALRDDPDFLALTSVIV